MLADRSFGAGLEFQVLDPPWMRPMSFVQILEVAGISLTCGLLFHAYVGYPVLTHLLGRVLFPCPRLSPRELGDTLLLIAAHNEQRVIEARVRNALALQPGDVKVVVVSDGSTDGTDAVIRRIAEETSRLTVLRVEQRSGKNHALNHALRELPLPPETVVVFTDANVEFREDAVLRLREPLASGASCAVGKLVFTDARSGTARAEGLYWRYENWIKAEEGAIGRLPFGNGAIFAVTAADIGEIPLDVPNDFWIPLTLLGTGRPVVYSPAAVALEPAPQESAEEFARKVRMSNRQMRGVLRAWPLLDSATRFQLISHKVIRWFGIPLLLVASGAAGLLSAAHPFFLGIVVLTAAPFVVGAVGLAAQRAGLHIPIVNLAAHFLVVHMAAFFGAVEGLQGKQRATWVQATSSRVEGDKNEPVRLRN